MKSIHSCLFIAFFSVVSFVPHWARAETSFYLPPDADVINVKADYGAKGDGVTDDTEAIQRAIKFALDRETRSSAPPFIFFPAGTYVVHKPIESRIGTGGWSNGWRTGMLLLGESEKTTILKLQDNLPAYQDKTAPEALLRTGSENPQNPNGAGGQAFRASLMNLTFDVGVGNPGAVGIDYFANNRGLIENVTIRSSDPQKAGAVGYLMSRSEPGPSFVKNLTIDGFDVGIRATPYEYCVTYEDIELIDQNECGIALGNMTLWVRNVTYKGRGAFAEVRSGSGTLYVENAKLNGPGGIPGIVNRGALILRNTVYDGFTSLVENHIGETNIFHPGVREMVPFFSSHPSSKLFGTKDNSVDLPVEETPAFHSGKPADWISVTSQGATANNAEDDDGPAIQKAIDSGKPIVYLPLGLYHTGRPIRVRGPVRKIMGMTSSISRIKGYKGDLFVFEGGPGANTIIEHVNGSGPYKFAGTGGTWTLTHMDLGGSGVEVIPGATGKFFMTDVISPDVTIRKGVDFWARQLNCEHKGHTQVTNDGSNAWIFGLKTEHMVTALHTLNGGKSELVCFLFPSQGKVTSTIPSVIVENSRVSATITTGRNIYEVFVRETRGSQTRELGNKSGFKRGKDFASVPWYVSGE